MATQQNYTVYAGDAEPLQILMTGYDGVTAIDLSTTTDIVVAYKRVLTDPDSVAYILKSTLVQTIATTGSPTGGTYTLSVGGQTTAAIAYNAAASAAKTALELLSTVGAGNSSVQGGPGPGTPLAARLIGAAVGQAITATGSFTGGSAPAITVTPSGGGVDILAAAAGHIAVNLLPADTAHVAATLQLQYAAKAYFSPTSEITGSIGLLTVVPTVVKRT